MNPTQKILKGKMPKILSDEVTGVNSKNATFLEQGKREVDRFYLHNRRYTGSKAKLTPWIMSLVRKECKGTSFADIFAGTGIVAAAAQKTYRNIILNDFLYSNNIIYEAFFGEGEYREEKLREILSWYNSLEARDLGENFFSSNFGNRYFDKETAKCIGFIREDIERNKAMLREKEYCILLASLIYATDKAANTVGHYDAYRKVKPQQKTLKLKLLEPVRNCGVNIFREDANELAKRIKADVVYIDPPYNSRQYSRFYHVLETLTKWDKPELFGVALKPIPENISDYCKNKASEAFKDLIKTLQCKYIVVSYNNTYNSKSSSSRNKISLKELKEILEWKGKTKIFEKNHKHFNSGNTHFSNHLEFIFITKVAS